MLKSGSLRHVSPVDQRQFPRKRVLFSGVITGPECETAIECIIRDISASGAQIQIKQAVTLQSPVYLIDTRNEAAHRATVAWAGDRRLGLSFAHSYLLDVGLANELQFLRTVLVEAKLAQVVRLMKCGLSVEKATSLVGVTEHYIDRFADLSQNDEKTALLLHQARCLRMRND